MTNCFVVPNSTIQFPLKPYIGMIHEVRIFLWELHFVEHGLEHELDITTSVSKDILDFGIRDEYSKYHWV